jgi:hypothetical protein
MLMEGEKGMSNQQEHSFPWVLAKSATVTASVVLFYGGGIATAAIAGTSVAAGIAVLGGGLWAANKLGLLPTSSDADRHD